MYEDEIIAQPRAHAKQQTRAEKVNGVGGALGLCSLSLKLRVISMPPLLSPRNR